jgi:NAD(P)-dependent dehydrogenase (short-subunit alcohol dehydrogenase family)
MNPFKDSVAIVTGGGSGIGAALAREAAQQGARVAVADVRLNAAQSVANAIAACGNTARAFAVDVVDPDSLTLLAAAVARDLGEANILFANAGVASGGKVSETTLNDFSWMYDVNVTGLFLTVRQFLPSIVAQSVKGRPAHIVITASENSLGLPVAHPSTAYTGTKHAVLGLSEGLRRDLKDDGVKVTVLCPGLVATNIAHGRQTRPAKYGGAVELPADQANRVRALMEKGAQDPRLTAQLCCEGIARGDFLVITDPKIRAIAERRHREVEAALALIDRRIAELS